MCLSNLRNEERHLQERKCLGNEFQILGAEQLKDRLPIEEEINGVTSTVAFDDRR